MFSTVCRALFVAFRAILVFCLGVSQFSECLSVAVAASGLTGRELGQRTGIDHSVLSRLMSGALAPSRINLHRLVQKFQPGAPVGLELLFAHLRDEAAAAGIAADRLVLALPAEGPSWRDSLPIGLQADLDLVAAEALEQPDFAALVNDWAAVIRRHRAALADKVVAYPSSSDPAVAAVAEDRVGQELSRAAARKKKTADLAEPTA